MINLLLSTNLLCVPEPCILTHKLTMTPTHPLWQIQECSSNKSFMQFCLLVTYCLFSYVSFPFHTSVVNQLGQLSLFLHPQRPPRTAILGGQAHLASSAKPSLTRRGSQVPGYWSWFSQYWLCGLWQVFLLSLSFHFFNYKMRHNNIYCIGTIVRIIRA